MAELPDVRPPRRIRAHIDFDLYVSPDWQDAVLENAVQRLQVDFAQGLLSQYASADQFLARPVIGKLSGD